MSDQAIIAALHVKRAELEGKLRQAEQRAAELRENVLTLDGALRIFDPVGTPQPRRKAREDGSAVPFSRAVMDVLRRAGAPMTCRQIATQVATARGMDANTTAAMVTLTNRVRSVLARKRDGLVSDKRGETIFWRVE